MTLRLAVPEMARSASRAAPSTRAVSETVANNASTSFAFTLARSDSNATRVCGAERSAAASANWSIVARSAFSNNAAVDR